MHGFWSGGAQAYATAIGEEYRLRKRTLAERLRIAGSEEERRRINEELRELKQEFSAKVRQINGCLF